MKKPFAVISTLVIAGLVMAACTNSATSTTGSNSPSPTTATGTPAAEAVKTTAFENFPTWGYDLQSTRHVPFKQINQDNIKDLGLVWQADFKSIDKDIPNGNQSFSPVVDGVIYVSTGQNHVFAFEAVTGKQLWHWKPDQAIIDHIKQTGMAGSNRGVAVAEGKVFMLIADNRIVSIDQKTGQTVKMVKLADTMPDVTAENGYYETTAPIYYKGNLYIGSSGGDNGARCFVAAYKASDLTPAWDQPFWTVPPKGQDWLAKNSKFSGGGAVWTPVSIDPETNIMYFGTGNPAPDFYGADRPGANPHTDSVVALDSKTGKLIWAKQEVSHDLWDYDAAATPMVLKAKINGAERKVVVQGGKSAQWWAWDAATGEVIYDGIAFGKIDHPTPTAEGVLTYPGVLGGENYAPETYDPQANLVLIPGIESPTITKSAKDANGVEKNELSDKFGAKDMGTSYAPAPDNVQAFGTVTAIDMGTGKIVYQNKTVDGMRGGLTSTAAGITFYGEQNGKLMAIETKTGKTLLEFQTPGSAIGTAPSIFTQDGKQYIAITSGGPKPKLMVFGLGGDKTQGAAGTDKAVNPHDKK
jgi:PQQ-dependent dehydrogenase (methanol/ethanol family)